MMIYHQTKSGCKRISHSEAPVETILHCDIALTDSKPIFLKDTLARNAASVYQVWLQKVQ